MGLKHFEKCDDIPEFPRFDTEEERASLIVEYLKAGAIAKENLIPGAWYIGQSRSTNIAQYWPTGGFYFIRYKLGGAFVDHIPHFFDTIEEKYADTDVFIPFKIIEI